MGDNGVQEEKHATTNVAAEEVASVTERSQVQHSKSGTVNSTGQPQI